MGGETMIDIGTQDTIEVLNKIFFFVEHRYSDGYPGTKSSWKIRGWLQKLSWGQNCMETKNIISYVNLKNITEVLLSLFRVKQIKIIYSLRMFGKKIILKWDQWQDPRRTNLLYEFREFTVCSPEKIR